MKRAYRTILRLYPADYRAMFAAEMAGAFDLLVEERRARPVREFSGAIAGAARDWVAKWTTDAAVRGRALPDLRMMRPVGVTKEQWFGTSLCS